MSWRTCSLRTPLHGMLQTSSARKVGTSDRARGTGSTPSSGGIDGGINRFQRRNYKLCRFSGSLFKSRRPDHFFFLRPPSKSCVINNELFLWDYNLVTSEGVSLHLTRLAVYLTV